MEENGIIMPIIEFQEMCRHGAFTNFDGTGRYATLGDESDQIVNCNHFCNPDHKHPEWATHVIWYNK